MRYTLHMPRHEEFPIKFQLAITEDLDTAINEWRRRQVDLPNRSEAIRRLIAIALAGKTKSARK